jgi:hypothetical protein
MHPYLITDNVPKTIAGKNEEVVARLDCLLLQGIQLFQDHSNRSC